MKLEKRIAAAYLAKIYKTAGSQHFEEYVKIPDVKRAFEQAKKKAKAEYVQLDEEGDEIEQDATGSIYEKDGFEIRSDHAMTLAKAKAFAQKDVDRNDKWGPAFAVEVGTSKQEVYEPNLYPMSFPARTKEEAAKRAIANLEATWAFKGTVVIKDLVVEPAGKPGQPDALTMRSKPGDPPNLPRFIVTVSCSILVKQRKTVKTVGWLFYGWAPV